MQEGVCASMVQLAEQRGREDGESGDVTVRAQNEKKCATATDNKSAHIPMAAALNTTQRTRRHMQTTPNTVQKKSAEDRMENTGTHFTPVVIGGAVWPCGVYKTVAEPRPRPQRQRQIAHLFTLPPPPMIGSATKEPPNSWSANDSDADAPVSLDISSLLGYPSSASLPPHCAKLA